MTINDASSTAECCIWKAWLRQRLQRQPIMPTISYTRPTHFLTKFQAKVKSNLPASGTESGPSRCDWHCLRGGDCTAQTGRLYAPAYSDRFESTSQDGVNFFSSPRRQCAKSTQNERAAGVICTLTLKLDKSLLLFDVTLRTVQLSSISKQNWASNVMCRSMQTEVSPGESIHALNYSLYYHHHSYTCRQHCVRQCVSSCIPCIMRYCQRQMFHMAYVDRYSIYTASAAAAAI